MRMDQFRKQRTLVRLASRIDSMTNRYPPSTKDLVGGGEDQANLAVTWSDRGASARYSCP